MFLLTGCGYVGEPLPPLMNIPERVHDLTAAQQGSKIVVEFTVPKLTTEGVVIKRPVRMDLRVGPAAAGAFNAGTWAASATAAGEGVEENGRAHYEMPAAQWTGKEVTVAVRVISAKGRDAGWSNAVTLTVVPAPERPADLRAGPAPQGVHLTWRAAGKEFLIWRRGPGAQIFSEAGHSDKPEWTDTTAEFGKTYSYRVQTLVKAGRGEAESELSGVAEITPQDIFPPPVPKGLTAVPSTASIELAWQPETQPGLAGYRVYRAVGNGPFERVAETQNLPSYSDRKIEAGKVYRYAVAAVKSTGMESAKSAAVTVTAP